MTSDSDQTQPQATRAIVCLGAILMATGIVCGAFGAHAIKHSVSAELLVVFDTAVLYHLIHSIAVLLVGVLSASKVISAKFAERVTAGFVIGTATFSGSLYSLVLTNKGWLGVVTPFGGTLLILSWLWLAVLALQAPRQG